MNEIGNDRVAAFQRGWHSVPAGEPGNRTEAVAAGPVAHVAGMMVAAHGTVRQRCLWCGMLLYEVEADPAEIARLYSSLLMPGRWYELPDGRPVTLDSDTSVRSSGLMAAEEVEPDNACTRLQPSEDVSELIARGMMPRAEAERVIGEAMAVPDNHPSVHPEHW